MGFIEGLQRDLGSSWRVLAGRPSWTVAAVLCLVMASGANTAVFTLVDTLLLRPLPFPDAAQLITAAIRERYDVEAKASIDPPPSATVGLPPASEAALPALLAVV